MRRGRGDDEKSETGIVWGGGGRMGFGDGKGGGEVEWRGLEMGRVEGLKGQRRRSPRPMCGGVDDLM